MGFETSLFVVQPVDDNLTCALCLNVYDKPTTACANGHVYCLECLTHAKERSNACPDCRQPMIDPPPLNRPLQNLIGSLKVKCEHGISKEGCGQEEPPATRRRTSESGGAVEGEAKEPELCTWEGPVSEYRQHVKTCAFRVVRCPLRCSARFQYRFLEQHKENECPCRKIPCDQCGKNVPFDLVSYHHRHFCPETVVKCEHCKLPMKRKELGKGFEKDPHTDHCFDRFTGHYKVCPKYPVLCEFSDVGCRHKGAREDMRDHHADNARLHARLVSDAVNWLSAQAHWTVSPRLIRGTESRVIESPTIPVFGLPYKFFARLHLEGEKVEVALCIKETRRDDGFRPTLLLRAIKISVEAGPSEYDYRPCFAKDLHGRKGGMAKTLPPDTDSVGKSAFYYKREVNEVSTTNDGEEIQRVRTTAVEVTRAMILGPTEEEEEEEDDINFDISFDVNKNVQHFLTSR